MKNIHFYWIIRLLILTAIVIGVVFLFDYGLKEPFSPILAIGCGIVGMFVAVMAMDYLVIVPIVKSIDNCKTQITRKRFEDSLAPESQPSFSKKPAKPRKPRNYKTRQNKKN